MPSDLMQNQEEPEEDVGSLLSNWSLEPASDTTSKIIKRLRLMVLKLLPVEVDLDLIADPTSSIISPVVVNAFARAGGDFTNVLPFALLCARRSFIRDSRLFPTDYDENLCRAMACEVIARRIIHLLPPEKLRSVMSTRFRYRELDGDESPPTSALETAIDQNALFFLSGAETQDAVNALWKGDWVQKNNDDNDISYVEWDTHKTHTFASHFDPQRLGVPQYQDVFRQLIFLAFLGVYSQAVASPLYKLDPERNMDAWEYVLYIIAASQMLEQLVKLFKTVQLASNAAQAIGFWMVNDLITNALLLTALVFRVMGVRLMDGDASARYRLLSFQFLSCVAPFIWLRLVTVFDLIKIIGTMQVIVFRMLRESLIFFILLSILSLGFVQSMLALDAADGEIQDFWRIVNLLVQALLGSPDFDSTSAGFSPPFGLLIYYGWSTITIVILLNVLIALFGTAYSDIYEDATNQFLAHFSFKTIAMIRAPDSYVYPAPFNLIETFCVIPFEPFISRKAYKRLNVAVMTCLFFVPLCVLALYEAKIAPSKRFRGLFPDNAPEEDGDDEIENPSTRDEDGNKISVHTFAELTSAFPDTSLGSQAAIVSEIFKLSEKLDRLEALMNKSSKEKEEK